MYKYKNINYVKMITRKNFNWDKKISELEKEKNKLSNKLIGLKSNGKNTLGQFEVVSMHLRTFSELRKFFDNTI